MQVGLIRGGLSARNQAPHPVIPAQDFTPVKTGAGIQTLGMGLACALGAHAEKKEL